MIKKLGKIGIGMLFFLNFIVFYNHNVQAAPALEREIILKQPTGEVIAATPHGDEKNNWITTRDGSVIVQGEKGYWYYGINSLGNIVAGNKKYAIDKRPDDAINSNEVIKINKSKSFLNSLLREKTFFMDKSMKQGRFYSTQPTLVILVEFNDISIKNSDLKWSEAFFSDSTKSVRKYYREVSNEKLYFSPTEETYNSINDGVVKVKLNYNHPNTGDNTGYLNQTIVKDALIASDKYIDFSKYDKDLNGYISSNELHVATVIAGYERSCTIATPSVWAHYWRFNTNPPRLDNKLVSSSQGNGGYIQLGEMRGECMSTIGVICHELGHDMGLPDLYDTDHSSDGIGPHSLMGSGSWGADLGENPGTSPVHLDPWSKIYLGFINPQTVTYGECSLNQTGDSNYNIIKVLTAQPNEYFLIENREFNGFDRGLIGCVNSGGMAIWHIDENVIYANLYKYAVNDDEFHMGVDVEESDEVYIESNDYNTNNDGGNAYYYVGHKTLFDKYTNPNSLLYTGEDSNINISTPSRSGSVMTARLSENYMENYINITSKNPEHLAANVPINSQMVVTFDRNIDQGPKINSLILVDNRGNIVPRTINFNENQMIIKPDKNLDYNRGYTVTIPPYSVVGLDGKTLAKQKQFSFTTERDSVYPKVISSNPANNSMNIGIDSYISVIFSENIFPGTSYKCIELLDNYKKPIPISSTIINNELRIKPSKPLEYGTKYQVIIRNNCIEGKTGNGLDYDCGYYALSFTTKPEPALQFSRLSGEDRYKTSTSISKMGWRESEYVVLVNSKSFPDALSAGPLAKKYNAPILLTDSTILNSNAEAEIGRLKATTVFVVGGTNAISSGIENKIKSKSINCMRISGKNRFETSAVVAKKIGASDGIFVSNGYNYPDSLSISSYAAFKSMPILLVEPNNLPDSIAQYIRANGVKKTYVVGGTRVVSDRIAKMLPNVERIAGADRYETNIAALRRFNSEFNLNSIFIASGEGFPDALSGSALASITKSPIILASKSISNINPKITQYLKDKRYNINKKFVLGGKMVVPNEVVGEMFKALNR